MLIKATQKYTRQSPRKVRLVANTVKDLPLQQAFKQLGVISRKSTEVVAKVMKQAVADAVNNHGYQVTDLEIDSILVTEGPRYRRFQAVSRGRAHGITKRTCHITVVLKTKEADASTAVKPAKEVKAEAKTEALEKVENTAAPEVKEEKTKKVAKKAAKK
jgi:large subunit ribosomal protein L22